MFEIENKSTQCKARAGVIHTPHGDIKTPAFIPVGTKATVKGVSIPQIHDMQAQAVLCNTYHLYLEPGDCIVEKAGGVARFMGYTGPTFTDSGGFQVFSLGAAFGNKVSKVASGEADVVSVDNKDKMAFINEEGVDFKSYKDGSMHRFTPERSMEIQHSLGADIIFAFDECTSPLENKEYQKEAMDRTHRWAKRCIDRHKELDPENKQFLFGVVQGGRFEDLRKESARILGEMDFDGYGVGGSFNKDDMATAVGWVNEILPESKPRHLLGIGEPLDIVLGVEQGCDTFDCVTPTRNGRNGSLYTKTGKMNIFNAEYKEDFRPIEKGCDCYTCQNYTRSYLAHLHRSKEMLGGILCSIHNLRFLIRLCEDARQAIIRDEFQNFKINFIKNYES